MIIIGIFVTLRLLSKVGWYFKHTRRGIEFGVFLIFDHGFFKIKLVDFWLLLVSQAN